MCFTIVTWESMFLHYCENWTCLNVNLFYIILDPKDHIVQTTRVYNSDTLIQQRASPLSWMRPKNLPESSCLRTSPLPEKHLPTRLRKCFNPDSLQVTPCEIISRSEAHLGIVNYITEKEEEVVNPGKIRQIYVI